MIIEDISGNVITNPDLSRGRLDKASRMLVDGTEESVYVYFPFNEDEQDAFDLCNQAQADQDEAICELYEMMG